MSDPFAPRGAHGQLLPGPVATPQLLTKREIVATAALAGLLAGGSDYNPTYDGLASQAVRYADILLKELEK